MTDTASPRPAYIREVSEDGDFGTVEKPLTLWERAYRNELLRKLVLLFLLASAWQAYALHLNNSLLFPTFTETVSALWTNFAELGLLEKVWMSVSVLARGYLIGLALAAALTVFAMNSRIGKDLLEILTSMFNPLPAIALLPLALLWFGLGNQSLIFVLIHSVLWPVALNTHAGFLAVSNTLRMVGRNYGLTGLRLVVKILIPAALPSIFAGLKIGWAFAWRTLIAAELVFGASSGAGGLGWFVFERKNDLDIPGVFAGLFTVILIGLFVEYVVFRRLEQRTIVRWGMQQ